MTSDPIDLFRDWVSLRPTVNKCQMRIKPFDAIGPHSTLTVLDELMLLECYILLDKENNSNRGYYSDCCASYKRGPLAI